MPDQIATADTIEFGPEFDQHRISGTAIMDRQGRYFNVPLVTHVEGYLYQGGVWPGVRLPDKFDVVYNLYGLSYELGPRTIEHKHILHDSSSQGFDLIDEIAMHVANDARVGPTLVHCQAGLNRSGLVAARALMLLNGDSADTAINKVRRRSPVCLCNESFCNWLRGLD